MVLLNKEKIHDIKYQVWEVKNEIIDLEEELKNEQELAEDFSSAYIESGEPELDSEDNSSLYDASEDEDESERMEQNCSIKQMMNEDKSDEDEVKSKMGMGPSETEVPQPWIFLILT